MRERRERAASIVEGMEMGQRAAVAEPQGIRIRSRALEHRKRGKPQGGGALGDEFHFPGGSVEAEIRIRHVRDAQRADAAFRGERGRGGVTGGG